jgi:hypothetical protein
MKSQIPCGRKGCTRGHGRCRGREGCPACARQRPCTRPYGRTPPRSPSGSLDQPPPAWDQCYKNIFLKIFTENFGDFLKNHYVRMAVHILQQSNLLMALMDYVNFLPHIFALDSGQEGNNSNSSILSTILCYDILIFKLFCD